MKASGLERGHNQAVDAVTAHDFLKGLWKENPVFVQALGLCPTLAVTNSVRNALAMALATAFVLLLSSVLVSLVRRIVPEQVRIATYILIIASFVTIVDYGIQAVSLDVHRALGAYLSLIVVNCIILGRAEAFAARHNPLRAALDALGMSGGFAFALVCLGSIRELLGSGTLAGFHLMPAGFQPWNIMLLPGGAFFVLAGWLIVWSFVRRTANP